jgi:hypothetical protein
MATQPPRSLAQEQLNEIRATEAVALFQANQAGRNAVERVVGLFLSVGAIAGTTAAATRSPNAVLPLPAFLLLLFSYMFQQYTDLTVIGRARLRLENLVNANLPGRALIYETTVAQIRQRYPLVLGMRLLQGLLGLVAIAATAAALVVAIHSDDPRILWGFIAGTSLTFVSAALSYIQMLRCSSVADKQLESEELGNDEALWISPKLHSEIMALSHPGEVPRQTAERLLRKALAAEG